MRHLVFIAPAVVSVFCGHAAGGASTTGKAEWFNCLADMNEARTAAGLDEFKEASTAEQTLPQSSSSGKAINADTLWKEICKIITAEADDSNEAKSLEGSFAYYPGKKDCKAAVQYWKDGFPLFHNELPPAYTEPNKTDVYTDKAVSFVALYNPKASPVASCASVTCTKGAALAASALPKGREGQTLRKLQSGGNLSQLEEEWQKIVHAIGGPEEGNAVSPVRPSLLLGPIIIFFHYVLL
ncbi:SAG family member [Eimeria necatrix]|uniref:SAG family member n=1 Tax=Eimeria necatrix TaxID=51315 RepID=U6N1N8_9EIME|nr:SAG family member [Eimeria necatrix]CDJ70112.1 SAG family member [Eimeria necatrix]